MVVFLCAQTFVEKHVAKLYFRMTFKKVLIAYFFRINIHPVMSDIVVKLTCIRVKDEFAIRIYNKTRPPKTAKAILFNSEF